MPSLAADALTLRRVQRIGEVDPRAWNALAPNDVYAQHGWLRVVESTATEAAAPTYLLLYHSEELVAAAVCYRLDARAKPSSLDQQLFGRLGAACYKLGLSLVPALLCAPLIGQGPHVLWRRDMGGAEVELVLARVLDALFELAASERRALAFAKIPADEHALLGALARHGLARTINWPVSYIDIAWDDFDAYLAHLTAKGSSMPTKVRREIAAPAKNGVAISCEEQFRESARAMFALLETNQQAYSAEPLELAPTFLDALAEHHAGASVVTVARADETLAGAALLLVSGKRAAGPLIGVNADERNRKAFTYFNLALYGPIRFCIEHGIRRLYLGAGLYAMKRRRGCSELELELFVHASSRLGRVACRLWCALHRRWVAAKLRRQGVRLARARAAA